MITIKDGDKLYVVVRNDLPPGLQLAQAIHAKDEFAQRFEDINRVWYERSNYICVLQVANEQELCDLINTAEFFGIKHAEFTEPDRNNEFTAAAFEPGEKTQELCKNLSLALR